MLTRYIEYQVDIKNWDPISLGYKCPKISHLLFADDLSLMARANAKSCQAIKNGLDQFCSLSGQSINITKSKILFSKNCNHSIITSITTSLGIKKSNNFGTYLGFPILHHIPRPRDYQFLIDKMRTKLASWKMRFFSLA